MKLTKASSRSALRDIEELIVLGVIEQEEAGGRSTSYRIKRGSRTKSWKTETGETVR
jgi:hypothetical protein